MNTFKAEVGPILDPKVRDLFARLQNALNEAQPEFSYQYRHVAPSKTWAGMTVNADGSDWNPGAGAGMYLRNESNTQWDNLNKNLPYDPGTTTVATECARVFVGHLKLSSTNRLTLSGTARIALI